MRSMRLPAFRIGFFRLSGHTLLGALCFLLVASPFLETLAWGELLGSILFSVVLLTALLAVGGSHGVLKAGLLIVVPAMVLRWLYHVPFLGKTDAIPLVSMLVAVGFTAGQLLRSILRAQKVDAEVLCGAISVYLLTGLFWAHLYLLTDFVCPGSFTIPVTDTDHHALTWATAVYFSLSTLTTAGYGDIAPLSRYARSLSSLEAVSGVLYIAILISRLVSLYNRTPSEPETSREKPGK